MFEQSTWSPEVVARFDELFERHYPSTTPESAALLDRICTSWRTENQAAAALFAAIGELFGYRLARCSDTEEWAIDTEEAVAAELAAALRISQGWPQAGSVMPEPCGSGCRRWPMSLRPAISIPGPFRQSCFAPI